MDNGSEYVMFGSSGGAAPKRRFGKKTFFVIGGMLTGLTVIVTLIVSNISSNLSPAMVEDLAERWRAFESTWDSIVDDRGIVAHDLSSDLVITRPDGTPLNSYSATPSSERLHYSFRYYYDALQEIIASAGSSRGAANSMINEIQVYTETLKVFIQRAVSLAELTERNGLSIHAILASQGEYLSLEPTKGAVLDNFRTLSDSDDEALSRLGNLFTEIYTEKVTVLFPLIMEERQGVCGAACENAEAIERRVLSLESRFESIYVSFIREELSITELRQSIEKLVFQLYRRVLGRAYDRGVFYEE